MITFSNAKINLGLNIVSRRPDGYHNLETIFYPLVTNNFTDSLLHDIIEVNDSKEDNLIEYGLCADCPPENNLVIKALQLFRREALSKGVKVSPQHVTLEKHIPFGAGIGGGSADASSLLLLLNEMCDHMFTIDELISLSLHLGADCPFFIINRPCFAEGVGEKLQPVDINLNGLWLVLVKDDISISTSEAFSGVMPHKPDMSLREIVDMPIEFWKDRMVNDFEKSAFALYPRLSDIKDTLYSQGAVYASMSGSGSSIYGIFRAESYARRAISELNCPHRFLLQLEC